MRKISRRTTMRTALLAAAAVGVAGIGALTFTGAAQAAEVKKLAILTPEEGTDYGWNQQGIDAAKAAAREGRRRSSWPPAASAMATFVRRCANSPMTAPA